MKYRVHIYAVCRKAVEIDADSQKEAVKKANALDMNEVFGPEYADEVQDFLVDEEGDSEYKRSTLWEIGPDDEPVVK